jgi:hypothetical protein
LDYLDEKAGECVVDVERKDLAGNFGHGKKVRHKGAKESEGDRRRPKDTEADQRTERERRRTRRREGQRRTMSGGSKRRPDLFF